MSRPGQNPVLNAGNAITNISRKTSDESGFKPGDPVMIAIGQNRIPARFGTIYADVPRGQEIVFIINKLDMLQLSINLGSFADKYAVKTGMRMEIYRAAPDNQATGK